MTEEAVTRIYANRWFAKFAAREAIDASILVGAVRRAEAGLIDAELGSGLIKQRIAREGAGRSGGYRTLIFFRHGDRAVFAFAFAKNAKANLDAVELHAFRRVAKIVLGLTNAQIDAEVVAGRLFKVSEDGEDL